MNLLKYQYLRFAWIISLALVSKSTISQFMISNFMLFYSVNNILYSMGKIYYKNKVAPISMPI